jgi:murein DD-endopeptidase MepM/ murein hydrolase activator NlpD
MAGRWSIGKAGTGADQLPERARPGKLTLRRASRYHDRVPRPPRSIWLTLLIPAVLVLAGLAYLGWRQSVGGVRVDVAPPPKAVGLRTPLVVTLRAGRAPVTSVEVTLVQGQSGVVVMRQEFPPGARGEQRLELVVAGKALNLTEGPATLEVRARDGFWRPIGRGDRPAVSVPVTVDLTPPTVDVLASTQYLAQGGGGLVVFRAHGAARAGVNVGGILFPAYPVTQPEGETLAAFFAVPYDFPTTSPVAAVAQDEAGNSATRPVPLEIKPRRFPRGTVELSEAFLIRKLPELAPDRGQLAGDDLLPAFLTVNRDQRRRAETLRRQIAARTEPRLLWQGAFMPLRNSQVFSNFAETRTYRYQGKVVDTQVHFGYDLASLRQSPVEAANVGVVAWVGPLSLYGNTIVIDHGMGLQTLYAHLSSIDVKPGDRVGKGQPIGRTGATGLATGDHLHYEVLIHGIPVTPLEWWDARWIRDHIGKPLREAKVELLGSDRTEMDPPPPARTDGRRRAR